MNGIVFWKLPDRTCLNKISDPLTHLNIDNVANQEFALITFKNKK
jgi:hypothetical protein